jgi:indole-3-glycerol phosphate synthase
MDKLTEIMAAKRKELASRSRPVRDSELTRFLPGRDHPRRFEKALRRENGLAVISEIKRKLNPNLELGEPPPKKLPWQT